MRPRTMILCFLALAALGSSVPSHAAPQTNLKQEEISKAPLESAEVKWRVVGLRRKSTDLCPKVDGWESGDWLLQALRQPGDDCERSGQPNRSKLDLREVVATAPLLHQLGLDRACAYTASSNSKPFPASLPAGLESAAKAQMALVPAAGEPDLASANILAQHFLDQTNGMLPTSPTQEVVTPLAHPVRLVFIDTQPDGEGVPHVSGPSKHGYTLVHLADQLACQGAYPCPVELATSLALPHTSFNPDVPPSESNLSSQGGNLGLVDDLASAIVREVLRWWPDSKQKHLILNLSLGWDGELLGELDKQKVSQLKPDAQLVYRAIQLARRSGALVIAAAGNRRGGGESRWPLLPAAWELHHPSSFFFPLGPPPVYAVGGVDWQGLPLSNYRLGGLPRRVAFGDHAVAQTKNPDDPTAMYTGSSVSTAVVSSIAAVVWQLRPELRPAEVMKLLSRSGNVLPSRADYYAWKDLWPFSKLVSAPHVRRLSLCRAVALARAEKGLNPIPSCQPWDPKEGAANLSILATQAPTALPDLQATNLPPACTSASNPAPQLFAPIASTEAGDSSCPLHLLPDMVSQRWVHPQPDAEPCPGCSFIPPTRTVTALAIEDMPPPPGYVLVIELDPQWQTNGTSIERAALDVDHYSGAGKFVERTTYVIPPDVLISVGAANGNHRLLIKELSSLKGCTATLNFEAVTVESDGTKKYFSVQSPVYVDP